MNKSSTKKHTGRYSSSSTDSSYGQQSGSSSSDSSRCRSKSPQHPKMSTFDGIGKPSWESFIYQFERTANRRHWRNRRKTGRLLDCLKDIALEYARKVNKDDDYDSLRKKMERRFSEKPEPVTARRQLQYVRQQETESLEDFAHNVYVLALDGYEQCEDEALEDIATEAFLRGCKEKDEAMKTMEKNPVTLSKAIASKSESYFWVGKNFLGSKTGDLFRYRMCLLKRKGKQSYSTTNMPGTGNKAFILISW